MVEGYQLGSTAVALRLPRKQMGEQVTVGPHARHDTYLRDGNNKSYKEKFRDGLINQIETPNGTQLITLPSSGYVEGPHGSHMMIVALGKTEHGEEKPLPTFSHFTPEQGEEHFTILSEIGETLNQEYGNSWFMGASISPHEWQRQAVQSIKTIHTHIIGFGEDALEGVVTLDHLDVQEQTERKRMLADPLTPLATTLLREMVFTPEFFKDPQIQDVVAQEDTQITHEYPKGYTILLNGGPSLLKDPRFFALVQKIDRKIAEAYGDLSNCFSQEGSTDMLNRPLLLEKDERDSRISQLTTQYSLSENASHGLYRLSHTIKPSREILSRAKSYDEETYLMNTRLMLNGYAYNLVIFPSQENPGQLTLCIVPRVLSGGSPLDAMGIYKEQFPAPDEEIDTMMTRRRTRAEQIVQESLYERASRQKAETVESLGQKGFVTIGRKTYEAISLRQPKGYEIKDYLTIHPEAEVYMRLSPLEKSVAYESEVKNPFSPEGGRKLHARYDYTHHGLFKLSLHNDRIKLNNLSLAQNSHEDYFTAPGLDAVMEDNRIWVGQEMETTSPKQIYGVPTPTYDIAERTVEEIIILKREITDTPSQAMQPHLLSPLVDELNVSQNLSPSRPTIIDYVTELIEAANYDPASLREDSGFGLAYSLPIKYSFR